MVLPSEGLQLSLSCVPSLAKNEVVVSGFGVVGMVLEPPVLPNLLACGGNQVILGLSILSGFARSKGNLSCHGGIVCWL